MTEQVQSFQAMSAEEMAALSPAQLMDYVKQLQEAARAAQGLVAAAKAKLSVENRQKVEAELRSALKFPKLGADVLAKLAEVNASGASVVFDLTTGEPVFAVHFPKLAARVRKDGEAAGDHAPAQSRPVSADYDQHASEAQKAEDTAQIDQEISTSLARGQYHGSESKARGAIEWKIKVRRLKKLGIY